VPAAAAQPPSPRIAAVLALDEPSVDDLSEFLTDADFGVRRTAVDVLTETLCDGYAEPLVAALGDRDVEVRLLAADGIRELVEVLAEPEALRPYAESPDPVVRGVAVYVLASRRAGEQRQYRRLVADPDHRVRIEAVRALVSVDDADGVAQAFTDVNREVRIAVANGLGTLRAGAATVRTLIDDADPLVRAAALAAIGDIGWDDADVSTVEKALAASAWQIRQGAARAFAGAPSPATAVPSLSQALSDPHLDVRKAAVLSLTQWAASEEEARQALTGALDDGDADVRAYARRALETAP
jgi:HEAT repeat protein